VEAACAREIAGARARRTKEVMKRFMGPPEKTRDSLRREEKRGK